MADKDTKRKEGAAREMEKFLNPLGPHTQDLVAYLNMDQGDLMEWEADLVASIKASVQDAIHEHFLTCAASRQKFESVPPEFWHEGDTGKFSLVETPRRMLGLLPKRFLADVEELISNPKKEMQDSMRAELTQIMEEMRASEADNEELADVRGRETWLFKDLEDHDADLRKWKPLHEKKTAIIAELEQREEFLEEIEEFEMKASGDKDRYKKANSLALADENKFRAYAAKKLKELDSRAIKLCRQYQEETTRPFEIDGVFYLEMIREQKYGRSSNPSLSLMKLRPDAISQAERARFSGQPVSNLVGDDLPRRTSLHETGKDPKIIRHARGNE